MSTIEMIESEGYRITVEDLAMYWALLIVYRDNIQAFMVSYDTSVKTNNEHYERCMSRREQINRYYGFGNQYDTCFDELNEQFDTAATRHYQVYWASKILLSLVFVLCVLNIVCVFDTWGNYNAYIWFVIVASQLAALVSVVTFAPAKYDKNSPVLCLNILNIILAIIYLIVSVVVVAHTPTWVTSVVVVMLMSTLSILGINTIYLRMLRSLLKI
jgi:hypothetical protein